MSCIEPCPSSRISSCHLRSYNGIWRAKQILDPWPSHNGTRAPRRADVRAFRVARSAEHSAVTVLPIPVTQLRVTQTLTLRRALMRSSSTCLRPLRVPHIILILQTCPCAFFDIPAGCADPCCTSAIESSFWFGSSTHSRLNPHGKHREMRTSSSGQFRLSKRVRARGMGIHGERTSFACGIPLKTLRTSPSAIYARSVRFGGHSAGLPF